MISRKGWIEHVKERIDTMNLAKFPRRRFLVTRSPIEKLARLSEQLGGPTL